MEVNKLVKFAKLEEGILRLTHVTEAHELTQLDSLRDRFYKEFHNLGPERKENLPVNAFCFLTTYKTMQTNSQIGYLISDVVDRTINGVSYKILLIPELYVINDMQKDGVGSFMLESIKKADRSCKIEGLECEIEAVAKRKRGIERFYETNGFKYVRRKSINGTHISDVWRYLNPQPL